MAKKHVDPLKAKQKKQKILAAVLGVVFLALVAIQGPKLWKQLNPPPTPQRTTETTPAPVAGATPPTLVAPTLRGAAQGPAPADPSGSLANAGVPTVQDGQLASFSRFASKDPFSQQLGDKNTGAGADSGSAAGSGSVDGDASSGGSGGGSTGTSAPVPGSAVISVNGVLYTVPAGTDFPQASETDPSIVPLFHLVSTAAHSVKISIVGGAYSSGARTVTLKENKAVTLMNTADGTRYKLILMPQGTGVPTDEAGSTTTPDTVTLPPATP